MAGRSDVVMRRPPMPAPISEGGFRRYYSDLVMELQDAMDVMLKNHLAVRFDQSDKCDWHDTERALSELQSVLRQLRQLWA
jgi:hypothetical protein